LKISLYSLIVPEWSIEETVEKVAKAGFDGIEWRVADDFHIPLSEFVEKAPQIRRITEDAGLRVCGISTYVSCFDFDGIKRLAEGCALLGGAFYRVSVPNYDPEEGYISQLERTREALAKIQEITRDFGVTATPEIHMGKIIPSGGLAWRLVNGFDPKCVGLIFDPGNMVYEGMENWQLSLEGIGEYLTHVHVKNSAWQKGENGWQPGWAPLDDGIVHWPDVLKALKAVGYDRWLSIEDFYDYGTTLEEKILFCLGKLKAWLEEIG